MVEYRRGIAAGAVVLGALGLVAATPHSASAAVPSEIIFNNPLDPEGAKKIEKKILSLVQGARSGSSIELSVYRFSNANGIADALIAADRRGVKVRVIADAGSLKREGDGQPTGYERVLWALGGGKVITCPQGRGCIGTKLNHTKFLLFSNTHGSRNVVVQTSQNLNATGGYTTDWNDAVVLANATGMFSAYSRYFDDLWNRKVISDYWKTRGGVVDSREANVQFFPKAGGDPVAQMLSKVKCTFKYKGRTGATQIRIAMGAINSKREWVLSGLSRLKAQGCLIEVIVTVNPGDATRTAAVGELRGKGIPVYDFGEYTARNVMHSKYILVQGGIGSAVGKWTWTGSANLTWGSLRQDDETLMQLKQVGRMGTWKIHDTYRCNFRRAKAQFQNKPMPC